MVEMGQDLRSILPGFSWNQYWFFGSLTRASNFLGRFFVSEGAPQSDSELDTHAAASYQRSMSGPIFVLTPARSAVFQRTCLR
jgi:hypothetical protein